MFLAVGHGVRRVALWGDYATADQGADIVSGLVTTYPVSVEQAELDGRSKDLSLERRFPKIYQRLREIARDLVSPCIVSSPLPAPDTRRPAG